MLFWTEPVHFFFVKQAPEILFKICSFDVRSGCIYLDVVSIGVKLSR